jgi:hypothetical protein
VIVPNNGLQTVHHCAAIWAEDTSRFFSRNYVSQSSLDTIFFGNRFFAFREIEDGAYCCTQRHT